MGPVATSIHGAAGTGAQRARRPGGTSPHRLPEPALASAIYGTGLLPVAPADSVRVLEIIEQAVAKASS
ncbi:hypothetical protein [Corynebacterium kalidii]|uniref:Uncharacterized protein n=1 Tax=Corynebacterium kalidii TaxID=2931982 RepID=A0A9X1WHS4_9CORY|nr:hypothetical protein [Corynebacterium kalidii]MCJ7858458.1 hypothetical protein [Corynebacterium kalidii]